MKLNKITADMVSRRPDQTAEWLNRLARQVDIVETGLGSMSKKPWDLPIATTYSLGVIKVGQNLSITPEGVLSALAPASYDYTLLFNKPKINNVELVGDKSLHDLGIDIPTSYWGQSAVGGVVGGTITLTDGGKTATISTTGHNSSLAGISIGNASNYIEAGIATTSVVSNTGNVNIKPKSGSSVDVFNAKIINLANPTNNNDAANKKYVDDGLATKQDTLIAGSNINIASDGKTISAVVPTKTSDLQNDGSDGTSTYVEADELATVATSGSYADLLNKPTIGNATLTIQKNSTDVGTFTANATSNKTIDISVPTQTSDIANNGADGTSTYVEADELATVATSGSYSDLLNKPTIGNATLTIQKNGTNVDTFTANATSNKTINITVPTTAADVGALPDSTKYAASLSLTINSSTYVVTGQLKDQDGNNLGTAQTIDLPLESVVVSGSYDSATKEVVLVLENGSEIRFSVADLVSGLQSEITSANPLDADLVDDSTSTNKFVTATEIAKLDGIEAGAEVNVQADWNEANSSSDAYIKNKPTIGNATLTIQRNGATAQTFTANATSNKSVDIQAPVRVGLNGQVQTASWRRSVIALCEVSTADNTERSSYSDGDIVFHRFNGLAGISEIHVAAENQYSLAYYFNLFWYGNINRLAANADIDTATGFRPCVFKYNNKWYGGIEVYLAAAQLNYIAFNGETNFSIFGLDYYSVAHQASGTSYPGEVINQEVYDSIDFTKWTLAKGTLQTEKVNIVSGEIVKGNTYTATLPNKSGTLAMTSDIGNATLAIQKNGTTIDSFTANATSNKTINIPVPTKTSDITNDGADGTSTYVENDDLTTALAGKQDTLTAGTNINIASNTISTQTRGIEYIVGTQASATNLWTGVSTDDGCSSGTLYTGKTIVYHLPYAGNNSAATLNLTLPDGTTTGAKNVKYNTGGNVGTTYGAGCDIFMVYDGTYWKTSAWYDSNNYDRIRYYSNVKAAAAISSSRICVGTDAGYIMAAANATFDINYPLLWAGSGVNSGATSTNFYGAYPNVNLTNNKSGWSGTVNKMVFLVGTLSGATFTIDSDVFTQTVPNSEDGKVYAPLGITYSTTNILFYPNNTYWAYKNGAFRPISHSEPVMTGAGSGTAGAAGLVPAPAAGDNTKYLSGDGTWKTVSQYALPIASSSTLGGVKVGDGLAIDSGTGVLSVDDKFYINVTGVTPVGGSTTQYTFTADQTFQDIYDAYDAGKLPVLLVDTALWEWNPNTYDNHNYLQIPLSYYFDYNEDGYERFSFIWDDASGSTNAVYASNIAFGFEHSGGSYLNNLTVSNAYVLVDSSLNSGSPNAIQNDVVTNALASKADSSSIGNATLTIQKNGTNVQTFTANATSNATANITVPTKTSDITNDSGYITSSSLNSYLPLSGGTMTGSTYGYFPATASTMVGNEYNILLNGGDRYTITQSGTGLLTTEQVKALFNGKLAPQYSSDGVDPDDPYVLLVEGLPDIHTQTGGVFGWTCRYYLPTTFKVELYDNYNSRGWVTIAQKTNTATKELFVDLFRTAGVGGGAFTKIRITIYDSNGAVGANGHRRWGISEIFFCHPEAISAYEYASVDKANTATKATQDANGDVIDTTYAKLTDLPTVNNATLTIQKNGANVQTFTANQATNATANITVPTKTSELTNDSGFVTDTTSQNFAAQEGSTNPVFDDMTPVKVIEWDVSDTTYRPIYQMENTGWTYDNMDVTLAYRITVTGTNIKSVSDVIARWHSPNTYPVTSILHRTLSTSASTTGLRYLRAVYPTSSYVNNNTYKFGQEVAMYNSTARHVKVEVFKNNSKAIWSETKPAGSIYQGSSTYQSTSNLEPYATRGWYFRGAANVTVNNADTATRISDYESYSPGSSVLKSGATALVAGHFAFLAEDGLVYDISNTAKAISVGESKVGWIASGVNANTAINQTYWRMISRPNATQYGYFSHDTMALGDRVYLRCTMDSSGKIHSDNYLAKSMSPGYTWMPMGFMTAATTFYADTRFPKFYTLDADGNMTHMDGIPLISYANGNSISY